MKLNIRFSLIATLALLCAQAIPAASLDQMDTIKDVMAGQDLTYVQGNSTSTTTTDTNAPVTSPATMTVPGFLTLAYQSLIGAGLTNLSVTEGISYTPSAKQFGEFTAVHRNLAIGGGAFVAPGFGIEEYAGQWYSLQLQTTLGVNITPLSGWTPVLGKTIGNVVVTPIATIGSETPFGGGGASGFGAFVATGGAVHLLTVPYLKSDLSIGGTMGTRTGLNSSDPTKNLNGKFYTGFFSLTWLF